MKSGLCVLILGMIFVMVACSPHSLEDFRYEGEAECRAFAKDLGKIETREDLVKALPKMKAHFEKLATLMMEVRQFQKESDTVEEEFPAKTEASALLFGQFKRIYAMESGREIMEKAQKEALFRIK